MTSELRPAVDVWRDACEMASLDPYCAGFSHDFAAAVIEADREAVRAEQAAELAKFKALAEAAAAYIADLEDHEGAEGFSQGTAELRRKYKKARDAS